ncbi:MAG: hypothetical protein C0485_04335 [Pirellula sp.]|nr:hypothetical protein [Pirellula sp.]
MNIPAEQFEPFPLHPTEIDARQRQSAKTRAKSRKNPQAAGRFRDLNSFIDQAMAGLTRAEIATWMTMFRYVDAKKGSVTVSIETIHRGTGTSIRHVHNAIRSLLAKGLIERLKVGGLNDGASVYRVHSTMNLRVNSSHIPVGQQHHEPFERATMNLRVTHSERSEGLDATSGVVGLLNTTTEPPSQHQSPARAPPRQRLLAADAHDDP